MAVGDKGFNCMRQSGFPLTITYSANGNRTNIANIGNVIDGDFATNMTWGNEENYSSTSCTNYYLVTFSAPVTVLGIKVKWGVFGREPNGSGSGTLKVNGSTVLSLGYTSSTTSEDETTRGNVTTVRVDLTASDGTDADLNPRGAWNYIYELEIYVSDDDYGFIV